MKEGLWHIDRSLLIGAREKIEILQIISPNFMSTLSQMVQGTVNTNWKIYLYRV